MNPNISTRLYMLYALMLLVLGWKICCASAEKITKVQDEQFAKIERLLLANQ